MADANQFLRNLSEAARDAIVVEQGTIINPVFCDKPQAKNWAAIATKDFTKPGGLDRSFFRRGPKGRVFLPDDLVAGQWIEFGGDRLSGMGGAKRKFRRVYREVVSFDGETLVLKPIAFEEIGRIQATDVDPPDFVPAAVPVTRSPFDRISDESLLAEAGRRGLL